MNLRGKHKLFLPESDGVRNPAEVLPDIFFPVSSGKGQIHSSQIPFADASHAGGKSMTHTGGRQLWKGQIYHAIFLVDNS